MDDEPDKSNAAIDGDGMDEEQKYYEERWGEVSAEEIDYQLAYYGDDLYIRESLVNVLTKLPPQAGAFALARCRFLSVGRTCHGMTLPGLGVRGGWMILLNEQVDEADRDGVVAHEIAHALLGHDRMSPDCPEDCETQAANLTKEWGFTGKGADAEYCNSN